MKGLEKTPAPGHGLERSHFESGGPAGGPLDRPRTRAVRQFPEPGRFWIAYSPRSWRCAGTPWTDLANNRLGGFQGVTIEMLPAFEVADLDDFLLLPPVMEGLENERDRLAGHLIEQRVPVLLELRPGESSDVAQARKIYDLLGPLLRGDLDQFKRLPAGSAAVWPLLPGLTDDPEIWDEGLGLLAAVGVSCVQPMAVELLPRERRHLAEGRDDDVFDALFHGPLPSERAFARHVDHHGLEVFMRRPPAGGTPRVENNRRIAADLALAGELWRRLGRSVSSGQSLFRAARGAESTSHHLMALAREKNLVVMEWLDAKSLAVIEEIVREGRAQLLQELMDEYLGRGEDATDDKGAPASSARH